MYIDDFPIIMDPVSGFRTLLGAFNGPNGQREFKNGTPNSVNMLLWSLILNKLSHDFAHVCGTTNAPVEFIELNRDAQFGRRLMKAQPGFAQGLYDLCTLDMSLASDDPNISEKLQNAWLSVMGYEAPFEEFQKWAAYFAGPASPYAALDTKTRVSHSFMGMFMSPWFLLER